jgi:hypothetical protein
MSVPDRSEVGSGRSGARLSLRAREVVLLLIGEGMRDMKRVVFVCVENSNRSQMAESFARIHGGEQLEAFSAGSRSSGKVNPHGPPTSSSNRLPFVSFFLGRQTSQKPHRLRTAARTSAGRAEVST